MEPKPIAFAALKADEVERLPSRVRDRAPTALGEGTWVLLHTPWPVDRLLEELSRLRKVNEAWAETKDVDTALLRLFTPGIGTDAALNDLASRKRYLDETPTLTAEEVHAKSGLLSRNRSEPASRWKKEGKTFAVRVGKRDLYPAFQFEDGVPRPVMRAVLAALPGTMTAWQTAFWFASKNDWLDGDEPQERLKDNDEVVRAAQRLADPDAAPSVTQVRSSSKANADEHRYGARLDELRRAAREEGYAMNEGSAQAFHAFLQAAPYDVRRAGLALAGDGDINAIWVGEDRKNRLSIQVFENGDIEYVSLSPGHKPRMARVSAERFWTTFSSKLHGFLSP